MSAVPVPVDCDMPGYESREAVVLQAKQIELWQELSCLHSFGNNRIYIPRSLCNVSSEVRPEDLDEIKVLLTDTKKIHHEWGRRFANRVFELFEASKEENENPPELKSLSLILETIDSFKPTSYPDIALEYDGSVYVGWRSQGSQQFVSMIARLDGQLEFAYRDANNLLGSGHCSIASALQRIPKVSRHPMYE